ncbi:MAG: ATP-grasp domain-containing protein [Proteobacteria bacterium]|nr:ATP-grasp domain-containing protein [Pseudomonadota bacterium]
MPDITQVLIANRGEIACRILRTLNRMDIPGVVVYHFADADSPAVKMAATAVQIHGPTPVAAYLDVENMIAACKETGADAVHPGFGFLAENPKFAKRLAREGITFIGPHPGAMELLGNKVSARTFCMDNGFPLITSVTEAEAKENFIESARKIGLPILIKAAAGGGGKGMQIVRDHRSLDQAVLLAKNEAQRSFGDDEVYAERLLEEPRHIEVQIMGDLHGNVVHLGERECSIQRRFQKIIEESPAPMLTRELREKICTTAVEIARRANYHNAGTVEFILAPDNEFYFLEMNTRLQVEHPVTEMVTGLDLVELQIRIARGETLPLVQDQIKTTGHAIELRLYAEDPANDFLPSTGALLAYSLPTGKGIRIENGFARGMQVTSAFDPMLAKLIVHEKNRNQAIALALQALNDTLVLGVTTNIDFLARILAHQAFRAGRIHTGFIPTHTKELAPLPLNQEQRDLLLAAAALGSREFSDPVLTEPYTSLGDWRN